MSFILGLFLLSAISKVKQAEILGWSFSSDVTLRVREANVVLCCCVPGFKFQILILSPLPDWSAIENMMIVKIQRYIELCVKIEQHICYQICCFTFEYRLMPFWIFTYRLFSCWLFGKRWNYINVSEFWHLYLLIPWTQHICASQPEHEVRQCGIMGVENWCGSGSKVHRRGECHVCQLPSSFSDESSDVYPASGDQMKHTNTLNAIRLGLVVGKSTTQQNLKRRSSSLQTF